MFIVDTHTLCTYNIIMKFEWDEKKRQTNIIKHRIDFADAIELFKGPSLILEDNRQDYGEERYIAFGIITTVTSLYRSPKDQVESESYQ